MPFLVDHPESAAMLVAAVVLGVLRLTFPKNSRHRLELWKAVLEHRRQRWQVTERRRKIGRSGKTGQPGLPAGAARSAVTDQPSRSVAVPVREERFPLDAGE
jgi:hypothetical protein